MRTIVFDPWVLQTSGMPNTKLQMLFAQQRQVEVVNRTATAFPQSRLWGIKIIVDVCERPGLPSALR